tara:strand:+ start:136 stop:471 length:336 start_codon:yes stop_codon:yes gene_type:complete
MFEYAKSLGDVLTVGIDSDARIKELKGPTRPINNQDLRMEMLMSVKWIDRVVIFNCEQELEKLIKKHSNTMVVGSDYRNKKVIGSQYADVVFFDRIRNQSTTKILEKLDDA